MDLVEELDNLLNNNKENSNVNSSGYSNTGKSMNSNLIDDNIAEKEDNAKSIKDCWNVGSETKHDNEEFKDCFIFSDDEGNGDFMSSDEEASDEDINNKEECLEKFLKDCEKITDNSDEEKVKSEIITEQGGDEKINEGTHNITNEQLNKLDDDLKNEIESSKLFPEMIIDLYDPDFELLDLRVNQLWKQIDDVQKQITEEKEFSREGVKEIKEFLSRHNYANNKPSMKDSNYLSSKCIFNGGLPDNEKEGETNNEETNNKKKITASCKLMETKGTNTFISAQTEAKISAKRELLRKMSMMNKESEANRFKRKLKEVEELCASEMSKVTNIICQLQSLENDMNNFNNGKKIEQISKMNFYKYPKRNKSNLSLPDPTRLKYLSSNNNK